MGSSAAAALSHTRNLVSTHPAHPGAHRVGSGQRNPGRAATIAHRPHHSLGAFLLLAQIFVADRLLHELLHRSGHPALAAPARGKFRRKGSDQAPRSLPQAKQAIDRPF
jgi:hypothetical protein